MENGHEAFYALNKFSFLGFFFKLCYLMVVETAQCCDWSDFDETSYSLEHSCISQERFGRTQELLFWSAHDRTALRARHHNIDVLLGTILRHQDSPAK